MVFTRSNAGWMGGWMFESVICSYDRRLVYCSVVSALTYLGTCCTASFLSFGDKLLTLTCK